MCTINYVPAACRERCTTRLVNIRVIIKISFKNWRAYKYLPEHKNLFAKSTKSCHALSFFAVFGAFLARSAPPMVNSCVSNMSSSSGVVFAAFLGVSAPRPTTRPATLGRAFSLHGAVADTIATPYVSSMMLLHIRMLSFIFRSPVASAFSLFVPCTWQTSTGFRRVGESDSTALLHLRLYLMLKP